MWLWRSKFVIESVTLSAVEVHREESHPNRTKDASVMNYAICFQLKWYHNGNSLLNDHPINSNCHYALKVESLQPQRTIYFYLIFSRHLISEDKKKTILVLCLSVN